MPGQTHQHSLAAMCMSTKWKNLSAFFLFFFYSTPQSVTFSLNSHFLCLFSTHKTDKTELPSILHKTKKNNVAVSHFKVDLTQLCVISKTEPVTVNFWLWVNVQE